MGGAGQQTLKAARVLVVGAGGLGAPVILYLAAAGVGTIGVVDDDVVALSNLQRQVLHDTSSIGMAKVDSAARAVARINPHVQVETHNLRLGPDNADDLIAQYDLVADGCDNFDTRYRVADICERLQKPLVTAAVGQFDGSITTLTPWITGPDGVLHPRYRDLYPQQPPDGLLPTCAEAGILGALTGVMGSMQALEVIKEITGAGQGLAGTLVLYDARAARFQRFSYKRSTSP
jgi:adenylyltransferase/sulfurtransferase